MNRRTSSFNTSRIDHLISDPPSKKNNSLYLIYGDMTDSLSLMRAIKQSDPDEIYNLAAQSHVGVSFEEPEYTANTIALGTLRILEIIKKQIKKNSNSKTNLSHEQENSFVTNYNKMIFENTHQLIRLVTVSKNCEIFLLNFLCELVQNFS
jgi:GDP-mannose 4,6-dehydratase